MRFLRSFSYQMFISQVGVALLTTVILVVMMMVLINQGVTLREYQIRNMIDFTAWQFDDMGVIDTFSFDPPGFGIVVDEGNEVVFAVGETPCPVGSALSSCAPSLNDLPSGAAFYDADGEEWAQVVLETKSGQRIISQRGPYVTTFNLGQTNITGFGPIILILIIMTTAVALPIAVFLAFVFVRPQVRRIGHISQVSQAFANGDFDARVHDARSDEVGQLGQQFDDMADALQQNFTALRELAQRNAQLASQVERSAIQNERIRLSRDLHDSIAQNLFSLSVSSRALPEIIERDGRRGAVEAHKLADLAEQTLQDLRSILVDLRPAAVITQGIAPALHQLCDEWETRHQTPIECTILLTGRHIPATVEDAIFRVTQEALINAGKHAAANSVTVTLVEGSGQISLSVSDDGIGFDPLETRESGHFGMIGMHERVTAVGGRFSINSAAAGGSTVEAIIPIERPEK